jgi:restriction endonuclease S subunit
MLIIPIQPIPNQNIRLTVNGQACEINLRQQNTGIYFSLVSDGTSICNSVLCQNAAPLNSQFSFNGVFVLFDVESNEKPDYSRLGTKWVLYYLEAGEIV